MGMKWVCPFITTALRMLGKLLVIFVEIYESYYA
jgi:hypothetical protein